MWIYIYDYRFKLIQKTEIYSTLKTGKLRHLSGLEYAVNNHRELDTADSRI
jgi:hypothetical protein